MEQNEKVKKGFVYIVECEDKSYYTGIAIDVCARMKTHFYKEKQGAKYTKARQVKTIKMVWEAESMSCAAKFEYAIKRLTRAKKEQLIHEPNQYGKLCKSVSDMVFIPRKDYCHDVVDLIQ